MLVCVVVVAIMCVFVCVCVYMCVGVWLCGRGCGKYVCIQMCMHVCVCVYSMYICKQEYTCTTVHMHHGIHSISMYVCTACKAHNTSRLLSCIARFELLYTSVLRVANHEYLCPVPLIDNTLLGRGGGIPTHIQSIYCTIRTIICNGTCWRCEAIIP
jgi:hypothetical protein